MEKREVRLKIIVAIAAICSLFGGCSNTAREEISFSGTLVFPEEEELPNGYSIFLMEERRQNSKFGTAILPIAELTLNANNQFSYSGYVCRNPQLFVPFGIGVELSDRSKLRKAPILVELTTEQIASGKGSVGDSILQRLRQKTVEFQSEISTIDNPEHFPC